MRAALLAAATALAVLGAAAPLATAHECESYAGCDADACIDGENHEHRDMERVGEDETCRSYDEPPRGPCQIGGKRFHQGFCDATDVAVVVQADPGR